MGVVGGSVYRVPQIVKIHRARSAEGINLLSSLMAAASMVFGIAYNSNAGYPLSTYGESIPDFICQIIVTLQMLWYSGRCSAAGLLAWFCGHVLVAGAACRAKVLL